jgi:hypothetical protein
MEETVASTYKAHPNTVTHTIIVDVSVDGRVMGCFALYDEDMCAQYHDGYGSLEEHIRNARMRDPRATDEVIGRQLLPEAFNVEIPTSLRLLLESLGDAPWKISEDPDVYCGTLSCRKDAPACTSGFNCAVRVEPNQWVMAGSPIEDLRECSACEVALTGPALLLADEDQRPMEETTSEVGGLFRWDAKTGRWQALSNNVGWRSFTDVVATEPQIAVALSEQVRLNDGALPPADVPGVRRSSDGGASWQALTNGWSLSRTARIRLLAVFSTGQVIARADGRHWIWRDLSLIERLRVALIA